MKSIHLNYCKGQIIVLFTLSLIVLVGMVGLAIDSGRAYGVKAKLSAAVDAAAIAAARALGTGVSDTERIANAKAAAQKFFAGSFPSGYMGVTSTTLTIPDPVHNLDGYWDVKVSATADMPTTFIRVLGPEQATIAASGETIRRDLDMILVLDVSGSLSGVFSTVQSAAIKFIGKFIESSDRIGLVAFASGAQLKVPINKTASRGFSRTAITTAISNLANGGGTASAEGMRIALNEINAVPASDRSSLRVIVFFSDGAPNGVPATFTRSSGIPRLVPGDLYSETSSSGSVGGCGTAPCAVYPYNQLNGTLTPYTNIPTLPNNSGATLTLTSTVSGDATGPIPLASYNNKRTLTSSPYDNTRCNVNKAARNMVENVANSARSQSQPIAIYSLGLGSALNTLEITFCGYASNEKGANILKRLANTADSDTHQPDPQPTGIYCFADINADPGALDSCFSALASEILRLTK